MAKFEISITDGYVPTWDAWCGIREILQNAQDQVELDESCPMKVAYSSSNKRLTITTENVILDRSVLLLGESGKRNADARGQFGEGLDLALLALVRLGYQVRIENGAESWIPSLEYSETWGRNVLVIKTNKFKRPKQHFKVEINGMTVKNWEIVRERVLFLKGAIKPDEETYVFGKEMVLLDRPKQIYARGLWVGEFPGLQAGYDLHGLTLDRDRKMANHWELKRLIAKLWTKAVSDEKTRKAAQERVEKMLTEGADDVDSLDDIIEGGYAVGAEDTKAALREGFETKYGADAVPVDSTAEAEEVEAAGLTPIPVSSTWKRTLEKATGKDVRQRVTDACQGVKLTFTPNDLRKLNLFDRYRTIKELHEKVGGTCPLSIVDFKGENQLGMYERSKENKSVIYISRLILEDDTPSRSMVTLAHEMSHHMHIDHGKAHDNLTEWILGAMLNLMWGDWHQLEDRLRGTAGA